MATQAFLKDGQWCPLVRDEFARLIEQNAGQAKHAIFDFDNTLLCRDIGEATFAALIASNRLTAMNIPAAITPAFMRDGQSISLATLSNLSDYYEALFQATAHQSSEPQYCMNAFAWMVQIMAGLTPAEIVNYTAQGYADGIGQQDQTAPKPQLTGIAGYPHPFFYPEMIDLVGTLLSNQFEVYIVSASNVWSVRWLVTRKMNPLLQTKYGKKVTLAPAHVIGVSVLLRDRRNGQLYEDEFLVQHNPAYTHFDPRELNQYELTTQIVYPFPAFDGKVAWIWKAITRTRPFLVAGDSPNDHPMLNYAEHRLWMTRLNKLEYQPATVRLMQSGLPGTWLCQPVLNQERPGFVTSHMDLELRLSSQPQLLQTPLKTITLLQRAGVLNNF